MKAPLRVTSLAVTSTLAVVLWGIFGNTEEIAVYGNSALWWWRKATAFGKDFDHARLIPFVCGYLIWLRRKELAAATVRPDWRAVLVAALAMVVYWLGVQGQQVQVALYSLWILLWAVVLGFWGTEVVRLLRFPLTYAVLAFPMGFIYPLTFPLRMASTGLAAGLLNGAGIAVLRNGTALYDPAGAFHLEVADPCSGLRSVFALVALTAVYAYLTLKGYRRWLLVAAAAPLAVGANAVRISTVGVVARFYGQESATGFYHDFSGYVFFISATLMMLGVAWALEKLPDRKGGTVLAAAEEMKDHRRQSAGATGNESAVATPGRGEWVPLLGTPAVLILAAVWVVVRPPLQVSTDLPIAGHLPVNIGEYQGRQVNYCQNENCMKSFPESVGAATNKCPDCGAALDVMSLAEKRGLPPDTRVNKRIYRNEAGSVFSVNTVIAGEDRRSIHRPEHCLPAQGLSVEKIRQERAVLNDGHGFDVAIITARRTVSDTRAGFAYWFVGPDRETTSNLKRHFWTACDRLFRNTASRWAYVSIMGDKSFDTPEGLAELTQFVSQLREAIAVKRE